ncbi:MAG TPA: 3-hydroxyacyl-CoA dehydrogenase NAD-binding domain-containing protein, partial [Actinomycetes bacterium]|nr:3-hydroxyacyl-CoA dehydrogenase NAD-binding domain-containing protein [Actinomycetes bacterium]
MTTAATERVCFVGAGTMGCANSLVSAVAGHRVRVYDVSDEALERVPDRYEEIGRFLLAVGYCSAADVAAGRDRITLTTDLEAATADADLVSESVFERLDLKRDVHARLDRVCPTHTILTTNTSVLLVSDIEDVVARGDRFAALHSHLASLLVDIVGGPRTSPATIDTLRSYVLGLGATPLVLKREHRGYVVNALVGSLLTAAMRLHVEHGLTIHDVDRAWMVGRRTPMGPFGMIDLFGTDVVLESWTRDEEDGVRRELAARIVPPLRALVDAGRLGQKTGAGFYRYPAPEYQEPG